MNTCGLCSSDVGGLAVEKKVGEGRPHQRRSNVGHLREFLLTEGHTVDEHQFTDEQVVLHENVKLSTTALINALGDVDEPSVKFSAGISRLDVVTDII